MKLRERLESLGGAGEGLPTFFLLPAYGDCVRLSGPELHGDIGVRIAGDDSGPTGEDGRTNEVTFDFRAADKAVVQAIVAGLGPEIREEKVRRPRQEVQGHVVPGHQPNIGHFLAWAARMPSMADHVILESAIDAGFKRAYATVMDSNVTALLGTVLLFWFGSGPVRGFAVVHCIGILTSMFSAVFFSRGLVNLWYGRQKKLKSVSIGTVWKPEASTSTATVAKTD